MPSRNQLVGAPTLLSSCSMPPLSAHPGRTVWDGSGPGPLVRLRRKRRGSASSAASRTRSAVSIPRPAWTPLAFAEGPGIGPWAIRLAAVTPCEDCGCALAPRPLFAYHALAARLAEAAGRPETDLHRRCPEGRVAYVWPAGPGSPCSASRAAGLAGPCSRPRRGFAALGSPAARRRETCPIGWTNCSFETGPPAGADLFRPVAEPDAFLPEPPSYATWSPQIHRAAQPELPS